MAKNTSNEKNESPKAKQPKAKQPDVAQSGAKLAAGKTPESFDSWIVRGLGMKRPA